VKALFVANGLAARSVRSDTDPSASGKLTVESRASQALESEWTATQKVEVKGRVISVDCAAEPKVCEEHGVSSFPAIRLYQDHGARVERYRGPRRAPSYVATGSL
jgi:hypothetical protein